MKLSKKTTLFIFLAVFFVLLDKFIKVLCLKGFFDKPFPIIGDILSLHYVKNHYIAFSLPFSGLFLNILVGLIIIFMLIYWLKIAKKSTETSDASAYPLTFLLIGAILNYTDRLRFGYVFDYFDLKWFTVFNLADMMILGGIIGLLILYSKKQHE
jgi:signal peptidase II